MKYLMAITVIIIGLNYIGSINEKAINHLMTEKGMTRQEAELTIYYEER